MIGWIDHTPLPNYPSIKIQRNVENVGYLRLVIGSKNMQPFSLVQSELNGNEWLIKQLEYANHECPDNADIKLLLDELRKR